ncbi:hypothetical protein LGH83_02300 [Lichenihabitans sp. PAMC28606]|uniref:hypothetical protein n=1 Tax=Lichenihabitans sp. PAMC28606 TaxID=2880932 RepID=UPI001D0A59DC|nr:hypothetical protein [Lichenihabitans sp. PAMC28606]UDL95103.1 hypothetical protein LGH83_02300 [Lichenihabitans sp. PAMC28606]
MIEAARQAQSKQKQTAEPAPIFTSSEELRSIDKARLRSAEERLQSARRASDKPKID